MKRFSVRTKKIRPLYPQSSENGETEKLLQVSKQDASSEAGPNEDDEDGLVVADYESDEDATCKNKWADICTL